MRGIVRLVAVGLIGAAVFAGCGGDDDEDATPTSTVESSDSTGSTRTPDTGSGELPQFSGDYGRVCSTQVGFSGAAEYVPDTPGPNQVMFMQDIRDEGTWIDSSGDLPAGWGPIEDSDFEDNSEFADVELISCADRTTENRTGRQCEFDSDGEPISLEIVDAVYTLTVYELKTGEVVATRNIDAVEDGCPMLASFRKGDKELVTQVDTDDVINALKEFVTPGA